MLFALLAAINTYLDLENKTPALLQAYVENWIVVKLKKAMVATFERESSRTLKIREITGIPSEMMVYSVL